MQRESTITFHVTEADTAVALGSGDLPVLATPRVVAWLEAATLEAARYELRPGETTVGSQVAVRHKAPSAVGSSVVVAARLASVDGRRLTFDVDATDEASGRVVAEGVISRAVVDVEEFLARLSDS